MSRHAKFISALAAAVTLIVLIPLVGGWPLSGSIRSPFVQSDRAADIVRFGKDVRIEAPVQGDVVIVSGSAEIDAAVEGDVIVFGGNLVMGTRGKIGGDAVAIGGTVTGASRENVGGRPVAGGTLNSFLTVAHPRSGHDPRASRSLVDAALKISLLLLWLGTSIGLTLLSGREVRSSSFELRASPFHSFLLGLVAVTSFVLSAIIFSYLVPYFVGVVLLALLGVIAIMTKVYGMVAVFHAIGTVVAGAKEPRDLVRRRQLRGDLAMVVLGFAILGVLRLIPVVGTMIWMGASIFGVGIALGTRFGRREPWFLALRPAEA